MTVDDALQRREVQLGTTGVEHHDTAPACVVCLTDLDTTFPDRPPGVPVLWAVVGGTTAEPPFGLRVSVGD